MKCIKIMIKWFNFVGFTKHIKDTFRQCHGDKKESYKKESYKKESYKKESYKISSKKEIKEKVSLKSRLAKI